jgi:creatinine amidohydrolase
LDGLVAESFSELLAGQTNSILLPTTYLPITALPHPQSISFHSDIVQKTWEDLLQGLQNAGFKVVCLISGHYAQGHELVLADVAQSISGRGSMRVLAGTPLALLNEPDLLDHAGLWETSQLLYFRPDLVDLDSLPPGALPPINQAAILGLDPREATPEKGQAVIERALQSWSHWIERLLADPDPEPLLELYAERRAGYQKYVDKYFNGSWESAILTWWDERSG